MSATCPDCGCGYDVPALDGWRCDACEADALRAEVATLRARVSELETHVETVADRGTVLTLRASLRAMKTERALAEFAS